MTTTELIELFKKYERGGATGRPREVMFEVDDRIIDTDGIEVVGSGDGLITELYLSLPSAQPEQLTDKEQRIFLAAMAREEKVCKEVDLEMTSEPHEDSLVRVCREIERKVKKALWTNRFQDKRR